MLDHRTLWRTDFTAVPPAERRVARFALQLVSQDQQVRRDLRNKEVLSALWQLTLPLFDPPGHGGLYLATLTDQDQEWLSSEESWRDDLDTATARHIRELKSLEEGEDPGEPRPPTRPADPRQDLGIFFTRPPRRVLRRLAKDDGDAPISATVALLGETLGLTATEVAGISGATSSAGSTRSDWRACWVWTGGPCAPPSPGAPRCGPSA